MHTKSNLQFCQKWIAGPIHFHPALCISLENGRSALVVAFPDRLKVTSGRLAPFTRHGFVGIELGLHRQLASSDITQFGVI